MLSTRFGEFRRMFDLKISDELIVLATLAGPVLAVQAQKWLERVTAKRNRRRWIFEVLMATRAARVAPEHVRALNQIELEFGHSRFVLPPLQWQGTKERVVVDAWRLYFDKLSEQLEEKRELIEAWNRACEDLFVDLLFALSRSLGYDFSKPQLRRGV